MELLSLFAIFFYVGLFTIGGGLAAIPLMQQQIVERGLISPEMFYNMIAISESTPGPIGINMATYIGFERAGVLGAVVTTVGTVLPSLIVIVIIAKYFTKFADKPLVRGGMYGVRAAVSGLIASAAFSVLTVTVITWEHFATDWNPIHLIDWRQFAIFAGIFVLYKGFKKHPIFYILLGAVCGVLFL